MKFMKKIAKGFNTVVESIKILFALKKSSVSKIERMSRTELIVLKASLDAALKFMETLKKASLIVDVLVSVISAIFDKGNMSSDNLMLIIVIGSSIAFILLIAFSIVEAKLFAEAEIVKQFEGRNGR